MSFNVAKATETLRPDRNGICLEGMDHVLSLKQNEHRHADKLRTFLPSCMNKQQNSTCRTRRLQRPHWFPGCTGPVLQGVIGFASSADVCRSLAAASVKTK